MANDQNKYIKQTFDCIPIIEALYSDQSKYYLYIIYHPRDEVWSGEESLTLYDHLPKNLILTNGSANRERRYWKTLKWQRKINTLSI